MMNTKELTSKLTELKKLKAKAEELKSSIADIENLIKAEMEAREATELNIGVYKIRYALVTSNRFDGTSFKKAMPELYNSFVKPTEAYRFTVA